VINGDHATRKNSTLHLDLRPKIYNCLTLLLCLLERDVESIRKLSPGSNFRSSLCNCGYLDGNF